MLHLIPSFYWGKVFRTLVIAPGFFYWTELEKKMCACIWMCMYTHMHAYVRSHEFYTYTSTAVLHASSLPSFIPYWYLSYENQNSQQYQYIYLFNPIIYLKLFQDFYIYSTEKNLLIIVHYIYAVFIFFRLRVYIQITLFKNTLVYYFIPFIWNTDMFVSPILVGLNLFFCIYRTLI